jgi:phenylacetate-CoA ligase
MRLVVDNPDSQDRMVLHCEIASGSETLVQAVPTSIRKVTQLRGRGGGV